MKTLLKCVASFLLGMFAVLTVIGIAESQGSHIVGGTVFTISQGGTNKSAYSPNVLIGYDGTSFVATGTPQLSVGNLLATTTATSTFKGNFLVGTSTTNTVFKGLKVQSNGQTGINKQNPTTALDILGTITASSTVGAPLNLTCTWTSSSNCISLTGSAGSGPVNVFQLSSRGDINAQGSLTGISSITTGGLVSAGSFQGDGAALTNLPNPFNQSLNTSDQPSFDQVITPGTTNHTFTWTANTTAPATQTLLTLPLNVYGAGTITDLLGDPDVWALVQVNGITYKMPAYLP